MAYEPAVWFAALDQIFGERKIREFSAAMLIGGKLRALYNEVEQPNPSRFDELLQSALAMSSSMTGR